MERIRGERPEDEELVPRRFLQLFGKGSSPNPDRSIYPSEEEIRRVFNAVHRQAQQEIGGLDDANLDEATVAPHPRFTTKEGALIWCGQHELLHAGQIGLLRRLFGAEPIR